MCEVIAILQVRIDSRRLPAKSMADLCGRPLVTHIIDRLQAVPAIDMVVLAVPREDFAVFRPLAEQYGASNIRLFGSVSRGEEGPDSDIDFLVEFPRGYDLLGQRIPLIEKLSSLLHRRVEVIPEHELNRYIREQVLSEAVDL